MNCIQLIKLDISSESSLLQVIHSYRVLEVLVSSWMLEVLSPDEI